MAHLKVLLTVLRSKAKLELIIAGHSARFLAVHHGRFNLLP